jgi:hypothetical protein
VRCREFPGTGVEANWKRIAARGWRASRSPKSKDKFWPGRDTATTVLSMDARVRAIVSLFRTTNQMRSTGSGFSARLGVLESASCLPTNRGNPEAVGSPVLTHSTQTFHERIAPIPVSLPADSESSAKVPWPADSNRRLALSLPLGFQDYRADPYCLLRN